MEFAARAAGNHSSGVNVETEIMLTAQYFLYSKNVWTGFSDKETNSINWYLQERNYQLLCYLILCSMEEIC